MLDKLKLLLIKTSKWIYLGFISLILLTLFSPFLYQHNAFMGNKDFTIFVFDGFIALQQHLAGDFIEAIPFTILMLIAFFLGVGLIIYSVISIIKKHRLYLPFYIIILCYSVLLLGYESYYLEGYTDSFINLSFFAFANAGYYALILLTLLNVVCIIIQYAKPLPKRNSPPKKLTNSERIAELEKQVAELKQSNESTPK